MYITSHLVYSFIDEEGNDPSHYIKPLQGFGSVGYLIPPAGAGGYSYLATKWLRSSKNKHNSDFL
jgi:hypothetical protein